jgi:hypothetical protein
MRGGRRLLEGDGGLGIGVERGCWGVREVEAEVGARCWRKRKFVDERGEEDAFWGGHGEDGGCGGYIVG